MTNYDATEYKTAIIAEMCADILTAVCDQLTYFEVSTDQAAHKIDVVARALYKLAADEGVADIMPQGPVDA